MENFINVLSLRFPPFLETGITKKMYACMEAGNEKTRKQFTVYHSLKQFMDGRTKFSDLQYKNFETMFLVYFALLLFYLLCFILGQIWKNALKLVLVFYLLKHRLGSAC